MQITLPSLSELANAPLLSDGAMNLIRGMLPDEERYPRPQNLPVGPSSMQVTKHKEITFPQLALMLEIIAEGQPTRADQVFIVYCHPSEVWEVSASGAIDMFGNHFDAEKHKILVFIVSPFVNCHVFGLVIHQTVANNVVFCAHDDEMHQWIVLTIYQLWLTNSGVLDLLPGNILRSTNRFHQIGARSDEHLSGVWCMAMIEAVIGCPGVVEVSLIVNHQTFRYFHVTRHLLREANEALADAFMRYTLQVGSTL